MLAVRPIVTVAAERDDPLLRIGILQQHVEPAFKPAARCERTGRIDVGSLVEKQRDEAIDVLREIVEIDVIEFLARLDAKPELLVRRRASASANLFRNSAMSFL